MNKKLNSCNLKNLNTKLDIIYKMLEAIYLTSNKFYN